MEPVLGDGISSELQCWMEGCVARHVIRNAGEFNGFLKPKVRLFAEPLRFDAGALVLARATRRRIDCRGAGRSRNRLRALCRGRAERTEGQLCNGSESLLERGATRRPSRPKIWVAHTSRRP